MECPTHTSHQVEYLLLECLQDLTGGFSAFFLASYSLMVDITTDQTRTRRLSFLDAFWEIGVLIGVPLGTYMKSQHGYIAVFSVAACVIFLAAIALLICLARLRAAELLTRAGEHLTRCWRRFCLMKRSISS